MKKASLTAFLCLIFVIPSAFANNKATRYTVEVTNITSGIVFTPFIVAAHRDRDRVAFFEVGETASDELAAIAEAGDIGPMRARLEALPPRLIGDIAQTDGLLQPGASATVELVTTRTMDHLSLAAMLLPTNDSFSALNSVALPRRGSVTFYAPAYDAGTELNDEYCMSIPGPQCGGTALSPEDSGEGYVFPSPGIHGEAELSRAAYNWQGPVIKVVVEVVR